MEIRDKRAAKNLPFVMDMSASDLKTLHFLLKKVLRLSNPELAVMPDFTETDTELAEKFVNKFKRFV